MKRSEKRRIFRKKFSRKSRLNFERGTERTWMECYRGDRRRLDEIATIYATTDMDWDEFAGWVKLIAEEEG